MSQNGDALKAAVLEGSVNGAVIFLIAFPVLTWQGTDPFTAAYIGGLAGMLRTGIYLKDALEYVSVDAFDGLMHEERNRKGMAQNLGKII